MGFSCYVWNYEFNKELAKAVKAEYPDCITVFGGHQINEESDIVNEPFADFILLGEGEESFKRLLKALCGKDSIHSIPNLILKENGHPVHTANEICEIPERVSPYLEGLFDDMVKEEELAFSAILETNRGCPNSCAFCDWGNIKSKVRLYNMDMIKAEIDWFCENRIEYCYCADANLGLFPRDEEIITYLVKKRRETGFPLKFQATYSKNNPETVFRINKQLNVAGMCKGATLSFQSLSEKVLSEINRKNMPLSSFKELMRLYNNSDIAAYSEIIIGLPGESYSSFRNGVEKLLEYGQHMSINFFNCELLANSIMNRPSYIKEHGIKSVLTEQNQYHVVPDSSGPREYSRMVVATSSLSEQDWVKCSVLSSVVRAFHNLGLLQCFAIYLYHEKGVEYMSFYEDIIRFARENPGTVCGKACAFLYEKYTGILGGSGSFTCSFPEYGELTWPLDEGCFLIAAKDINSFYEELTPFLKERCGDGRLFDELTAYQKATVKNPFSKSTALKLHYDFPAFFASVYDNSPKALERKDVDILIHAEGIPSSLPDFAREIIWFGRKGGRNIIRETEYV